MSLLTSIFPGTNSLFYHHCAHPLLDVLDNQIWKTGCGLSTLPSCWCVDSFNPVLLDLWSGLPLFFSSGVLLLARVACSASRSFVASQTNVLHLCIVKLLRLDALLALNSDSTFCHPQTFLFPPLHRSQSSFLCIPQTFTPFLARLGYRRFL